MEHYVYWFVSALVLLAAEMATGTFYMLVLSIAVALGGVAAFAGVALPMQITLAGVAAVAGTVILRRIRSARPADAAHASLDIGQPVKVIRWNDDGTARVHYRGAEWDAEAESAPTSRDPSQGGRREETGSDAATLPQATLYIKAIQGSKLILTQHKP